MPDKCTFCGCPQYFGVTRKTHNLNLALAKIHELEAKLEQANEDKLRWQQAYTGLRMKLEEISQTKDRVA